MGRNIIHGSDSVDVRIGLLHCAPLLSFVALFALNVVCSALNPPVLLCVTPQSAQKEIALWFKPSELAEYQRATEQWIYEK